VSEIADFLRARYAERRALAIAASPGPWHANAEHDEVVAEDGITVADGFALSGRQLRATVDHIAANDPTDVIADLDAKLAIIELHTPVVLRGGSGARYFEAVTVCRSCETPRQFPEQAYPCPTIRLLAQPFAGHPDHKGEEWAP
jgi:hypothetical protein